MNNADHAMPARIADASGPVAPARFSPEAKAARALQIFTTPIRHNRPGREAELIAKAHR